MCKEDKLIFLFTRVSLNRNEVIQVEKLLTAHLDWNYILKKSQREGVSYLIYYHLYNFKSNQGISQYLDQLKIAYHRNSIRNTIIIEEAKKVLKIFNEQKIRAIILKGVFLLKNIYKNIALREIADIDILIKKEDLPKVNSLLNSLDYLSPPYYKDSLRCKSSSLNSLVYRKKYFTTFFIHLHWHLINSSLPKDFLVKKIDMQRIWSQAEPINIDNIAALGLSPLHSLIYSAQHNFAHAFDRLILFSDILEISRYYKDKINWQLVRDEAERFDLSFALYYTLGLSSRLLSFEIPQIEKFKRFKSIFFDKFFSFLIYKGVRTSMLPYFTYLSQHKGFLGKLRFIFKTIFPSRYVLAHNLTLSSSQIRPYHYYQRIINNFVKSLR